MNFLLEITKDQYNDPIIFTATPAETLLFGLKIFLIGMGAVFTALCLIWLALYVFKIVFHDLPSKKTAAPQVVAQVEETTATVEYVSSDEEIIAVIAAAVAMAESENSGAKFKVVSFKRV